MQFSRPLLCLIIFSFLFQGVTMAQKDHTAEADMLLRAGAYHEAIDAFKKAYSKESDFDVKKEILYKIGFSYYHLQEHASAEDWLSKAVRAQYDDPDVHYYLGQTYKKQSRFDDAISQFQKLKEAGDPRGDKGIESSKLAQEWKDNPTRYKVEPEQLLNSKQADFSPVLGGRKNDEMIFTSTREGSAGGDVDPNTGQSFSGLWTSQQDRKGKWMVPTLVEGEGLNSEEANEGSATLDKRGRTLYFTRCKVEKNQDIGCKIFVAQKRGRSWDKPEEFEHIEVPDSVVVAHPSMGLGDEYLFFVSDMAGGKGGYDIWYMKSEKRGREWTEPKNLEGVNTEGDEMFPYIRDNGTLYFASDGHPGMGGLDIFKAERQGDDSDEWGNVQNMKSPINSPANDFGIVFDGEEETGYFSTDRPGGRGKDDIWSFRIPPLRFIIDGMVTDLVTGDPITNATVQLDGTDGSSVQLTTDELGYFEFDEKDEADEDGDTRYIKPNTSYTMEVSAEGYLKGSGQETTVGVEQSTRFNHDFKLQPIGEDEIEFPEVRYDLNDHELQVNDSVNSKDSLDYLYQTLIDNPNIVIELMAHTDTRGSASYNQDLSQRRAESCVNYLIEKGIHPDRLKAKGYGEHEPIISDAEIAKLESEEEKEAAHQKNRRTTFRVLRDDFVPPQSDAGDEADDSDDDATEN